MSQTAAATAGLCNAANKAAPPIDHFPNRHELILRERLLWKVSRIDPLMHAIINDKNCRFLAVFEKLSVVFMAQRFNVYSSTIPSKFPQCLQD
jgi:hypothetical protein